MREQSVQAELTSREVLFNSEAMYLVSYVLTNEEVLTKVIENADVLEALTHIVNNEDAWKAFAVKMMKICITAQTKKGC